MSMSIKVTFNFLDNMNRVKYSFIQYVPVIPNTGDYVQITDAGIEYSGTVWRVCHFYNEFKGTEIRINVK